MVMYGVQYCNVNDFHIVMSQCVNVVTSLL